MVNQHLSRIVRHGLSIFILIAALIVSAAPQQRVHAASQMICAPNCGSAPITASTKSTHDAYGKLPTSFIVNAGQLDPSVRFEVRSSAGHLFFTPQGVTLTLTTGLHLPKPIDDRSIVKRRISNIDNPPQTNVSVRVSFDGANPNVVLGGAEQQPGIANFFIGNDPTQWHTNVPTYAGVEYHDLYPGIDLSYNGQVGLLKGTYTVAPGADPTLIRWHYDGATTTRLDPASGDLLIDATEGLTLTEQVPEVWQTAAYGVRHAVTAHYMLAADGATQFMLGNYDPALPLVIDPGLVYSTYLGGSGDDVDYGVIVDSSGNAYVEGYISSANFPTTAGAFQTIYGGIYRDAFVTKLNAAGTGLVYSTFLGGSDFDSIDGIAVDSSSNVYVTGTTQSTNFPITAGSFQTTSTGGAFVVKLNAAGSKLVYSTFLNGSAQGDNGAGIAVDYNGNAYVTGSTNSSDFPTTAGAFQTVFGGGIGDVFVTKLNTAGTGLIYSTFLGGGSFDGGYAIAVDSSGSAYITGDTYSDSFPTTTGAFQTVFGANIDSFVVKLNVSGTGLVYSTYLGGSAVDDGSGIAVDSSGNAYITGDTRSNDFPTTAGAFQSNSGGVFVVKINAVGSKLVYSTCLGGNSAVDFGIGIAVDSSGSAYVTGYTASPNFPTTAGAFQTTSTGGAFVVKLNISGTGLVYSTYLGGNLGGTSTGIAVDSNGNIYVTGYTNSTNFPTTSGAFQTTIAGGFDLFITKFGPFP
ncbi:MAG: SBBP repeat-containing protein [Chloroflexota bacterium]